MLESCGRQRAGGRGRRGQGRDRVKESGRGGGRENRTNIQTHERVEKEE